MNDRRKLNIPPKKEPAVDAETVAAIDEVIAKGMKQTWVLTMPQAHITLSCADLRGFSRRSERALCYADFY